MVKNMGAFDRIVIKTKCPYCSYISDFEFQTDSLGQMMRTFRKNDEIKALDFVIKEGVIKNCGGECRKCGKIFYADFTVNDGKLVNVKIKKK